MFVEREEIPSVKKAVALLDNQLHLTFKSGETKLFDANKLLEIPLFSCLQEKELFNCVTTSSTICWTDALDVDPCTLYEKGIPTEPLEGMQKLVAISTNEDYSITASFENGERKVFPMRLLVDMDKGDFSIKDKFHQAYVNENGDVVWDVYEHTDGDIPWTSRVYLSGDNVYLNGTLIE